jgi:hypothetical protein
MGLLLQYQWVTHQYPWVETAWLLMSVRFVVMNVFHCRLEYFRQRNFVAPPIYRGVICWDEYFLLSIGIFSPTEFRSPTDLSRGLSPTDLTHQYPWAKANMAIDVSTICWDECFSLSFGILSPMELIHQYSWVTHQYPWAKAAWLLMSARFVWMNIFHCLLGIMSPTDFRSPADLSRGYDVSTICWDECFALSIGLISPNSQSIYAVFVHYLWSINAVSIQYQYSINTVSMQHQCSILS